MAINKTDSTKKVAEKKAVVKKTVVKKVAASKPAAKKVAPKKVVVKPVARNSEPKIKVPKAKGARPTRTKETTPPLSELKQHALAAARYAIEKKATDVHLLDLHGITSITDYFIIASGDSEKQVKAIAENVIVRMRDDNGVAPWHSEGWDGLKWIIVDFVDFVVHVFQAEARMYYNLERLWADAPSEEIKDEIPVKTPAKRVAKPKVVKEKNDTARVRIISSSAVMNGVTE
jgi:ribosome-associated protein